MIKTKSNFCLLLLILVLFAQLSSGQTTNQTTTNDTAAYQTAEQPFPQSAIDYMATREMRYHHYMWHQVRENWNLFSAETQAAFTAIGWAPPNPARNYDPVTGEATAVLDNYSGEDFLYMHRTMIATINEFLAENEPSYGNVQGWTTLPAPGDPDYPVPPNYTIPNNTDTQEYVDNVKTDSFWTTIAYQEQMYKDPVQLRNMTLAVLGAQIDVTIHSYLHMRFSAESPLGYRDSYRGTIPYIDHQWDNSTYNWMGDTYASHVNPLFWKVHGWIDDRIQDWMNANNLSAITWHSQWTGGPMSNLSAEIDAKQTMLRVSSVDATTTSDDSDALGNVLQQAAQILFESGVPDASPADKVSLP